MQAVNTTENRCKNNNTKSGGIKRTDDDGLRNEADGRQASRIPTKDKRSISLRGLRPQVVQNSDPD